LNDARARFGKGGFFLFGSFTCADAMYAPLARRFRTYYVDLTRWDKGSTIRQRRSHTSCYARLDEGRQCRSRNGESEVRPS
jgi:glutathione S-transferase